MNESMKGEGGGYFGAAMRAVVYKELRIIYNDILLIRGATCTAPA